MSRCRLAVLTFGPERVSAKTGRSLIFSSGLPALWFTLERYPDARTMRTDLGFVRAGREPPYATAAARGRP
jgi:hypothetical protein